MSIVEKKAAGTLDIPVDSVHPSALGGTIVHSLGTKGFCAVELGLDKGTFRLAVDDAKKLDNDEDSFSPPPAGIAEGLLGMEGSTKIAELEPPENADVDPVGENLRAIDLMIKDVAEEMIPHLQAMGCDVSQKTNALLHMAGDAPDDDDIVQINEKDASKWLGLFTTHRIMMVIYLGPSPASLELQPYGDEESAAFELAVSPGTMIVLRPDILSHKLVAAGEAFSVSSFLLHWTPWYGAPTPLIPVAKSLDDWIVRRLGELKEAEEDFTVWNPEIPREWQKLMNHMYHKQQLIAVRGMAARYPSTWDPGVLHVACYAGTDFVTEVPLLRWDNSRGYNPDPEAWQQFQTSCRHGAFSDGIELFDNKMFTLSPAESKGMDPNQRVVLEVAYDAMHRMGLKKGKIMNSSGGVYVGHGDSEWGRVEKAAEGGEGATGGAPSITSNRLSFVLGMKGPSMTIDTEGCSSMSALFQASESVQVKQNATPNKFAVGMGVTHQMAQHQFIILSIAKVLCREGRCFSFNMTADGYVRCDAGNCCAVDLLTEKVDDVDVVRDEDHVQGVLAGAVAKNCGKRASLSAPFGPAEQEAVVEALRNATLTPTDVDACEAHANGVLLADAVELNSLLRSHRYEEHKEPLQITNQKTLTGNMLHSAGMAGFINGIYSAQYGAMLPCAHLREINVHALESDQFNCCIETVGFPMSSSYQGTMSQGFGGSIVYTISFAQMNYQKRSEVPSPFVRMPINYWPGGGGEQSFEAPRKGFYLVGSWTSWKTPVKMTDEGDGTYGYTLPLSENRWEQFQIWLDGDESQVMCPVLPQAPADAQVYGPTDEALGYNWLLDGRSEFIGDHHPDVGNIGDLYRIELHIKGKWRTVTWKKEGDAKVKPGQLVPSGTIGTYHVATSWSEWAFSEMKADSANPGIYNCEVTLPQIGGGGAFMIVRNEDWLQTFYPPGNLSEPGEDVLGPDYNYDGFSWVVTGDPGAKLKVQFQRTHEGGTESRKISWQA